MRTPLLAASAVALLALAACHKKAPQVLDTNPDPMASVLANAKPVELPPSIKASVTFRCKDNSLVYVDFFSGDKQANLKTDKAGTAIHLTAVTAGDPLTAEGYTLNGTPKAITLTQPGKGELTCKG